MPDLALEVQRGSIPGHPGAKRSVESDKAAIPAQECARRSRGKRWKTPCVHKKFIKL
jgi:hypothetical protein